MFSDVQGCSVTELVCVFQGKEVSFLHYTSFVRVVVSVSSRETRPRVVQFTFAATEIHYIATEREKKKKHSWVSERLGKLYSLELKSGGLLGS